MGLSRKNLGFYELVHRGAAGLSCATCLVFAATAFGQTGATLPTGAQYDLVTRSVKLALENQTRKVSTSIVRVPEETRKNSLGGLAAFAQLKRESAEAYRIRNVLQAAERARLLRQELPLAAIDLAISNSADRQSAAIAARNDFAMAQIANELAQLTALQRGIPVIPNRREVDEIATRLPAAAPVLQLPPLQVVDRIYLDSPVRNPPARGGGVSQ